MLIVSTKDNHLHIGKYFTVTFQRTLRIPDDGKTYPLPPGLGCFPIFQVKDYIERVPPAWKDRGGIFIPMYQREALWLNFGGAHWRPNALKIAVGKVNAITGKLWDQHLHDDPQDYLVCPDQPWLDGINAGEEYIRQFVAMPLGMGYTVEGQVTGSEEFGGVQIIVFDPKPGRFPDKPPRLQVRPGFERVCECCAPISGAEMGLAAGGKMKQKIYPDEYGVDTWDEANFGRVYVHIVNSMVFRDITGLEPPSTPVSAKMYTEYGYPWFELYDEDKGDLAPADALGQVKSVKEMDQEKGFTSQQDDTTVNIEQKQVKKIKTGPTTIKDGEW